MQFSDLSHQVIGCAIEVHKQLGPGLLESAYEQCLAHELTSNRIPFKIQHQIRRQSVIGRWKRNVKSQRD